MTRSDEAASYFAGSYNCSQSVFTVFAKENGFTEDQALKLSTAFGGGMGRRQLTCGAVTGALMAIGLFNGRGINDPVEKKDITYRKAVEFMEEFKSRHGSLNCLELLQGLNMNDPDDQRKIGEQKLFQTACPRFVRDAVGIVEKMLANENFI
jgi:C_GCAxxG_C_C family probable redox protein